jgi:hypothetical protein
MKRRYYIYDYELWNDDLEDWWLAIEGEDKTHMVKLHGSGVLEGLEVLENDPTPDMNVLAAAGYAWDGYGDIIHPLITTTVNCALDKLGNATIPGTGKERLIAVAAKHARKESVPQASVKGWPEEASGEVYTLDEDWYEFVVLAGEEADPGEAVAPTPAVDEVLLCLILLEHTTTAITEEMIDNSARSMILNASDQIAGHLAADPAHAADNISETTYGRVQTALDRLRSSVATIHTDTGAANAYAITTGRTALLAGETFIIKIGAGNTNTLTACTLQVDAVAAKSICLRNGVTGPPAGCLQAGWHYLLLYNGSAFEILSDLSTTVWLGEGVTVLSGGNATTWTQVDLSGAVPAGAKAVFLQGKADPTAGSSQAGFYVRKSGGGPTIEGYSGVSGGSTSTGIHCVAPCELSSALRIDYYSFSANIAVTLIVIGYVI